MGYYVIIDPECFPMQYTYVEEYDDLIKIEGINKKSIIFSGSPDSPPQQVGISIKYHDLAQDWYRAGLKAQRVFAKLAEWRGLVLEELSQDPESFKAYTRGIKERVKRGDFLIRNCGNIEIEVKCRTFYGKGEQKYFFFSEQDLKKHLNMEKVTKTPVVVAVFQRKKDIPLENSLCMISIDHIHELSKLSEREKQDYGYVYRIPLKETVAGFDLIQEYKAKTKEDKIDLLELEKIPYSSVDADVNVVVAYYKSQEHLDWIVGNGLYNFRGIEGRGAVDREDGFENVKYILLHTKGEMRTGKLFQILNNSPVMYSKKILIEKGYPGMPMHEFYLVYQVTPVLEKELQDRIWDISEFPGYLKGYNAALPFVVPLSELLK